MKIGILGYKMTPVYVSRPPKVDKARTNAFFNFITQESASTCDESATGAAGMSQNSARVC